MTSARARSGPHGSFSGTITSRAAIAGFPETDLSRTRPNGPAWGTWSATIQPHAFLGDAQEPRPRLELLRQPAACSFDGDLRFAHLADPQGPPARKPAGSRTQTPR